jgi:hypothetical protein
MPSIRGLPALIALIAMIAMIFAPIIELRLFNWRRIVVDWDNEVILFLFRLDEKGKMKTGVFCGLGFNPVTNTSLYPNHDMDIGFDVQVSTEDLVRVCQSHFSLLLAYLSL